MAIDTTPDAPGRDAPAVEAPAVEAPAVEAPAVEAPAVEAPAVETAPSPRNMRSTRSGKIVPNEPAYTVLTGSDLDDAPAAPINNGKSRFVRVSIAPNGSTVFDFS